MKAMDDIASFSRRLAETITWCSLRASAADPANSLRSPLLRPDIIDESKGWMRYDWPTHEARDATITALAHRRASALRVETPTHAVSRGGLAGGRLLLYHPDANLFDGAAAHESCGYYDVDNVPPWDTWIAYRRDAAWPMAREEREHAGFHAPLYDNEPCTWPC